MSLGYNNTLVRTSGTADASNLLMVVYTLDMAKKGKLRPAFKDISRRKRALILPILVLISVGAIILALIVIFVANQPVPGSRYGVGADGFRAFTEKDGDIGIANVVSKEAVVNALGSKAKKVDDVQVSSVFNLNGSRGQTATFGFTRQDGRAVSLYVDEMIFKNKVSFDEAKVTVGTASAGTVNGHPIYFMHAQTIGSTREYRLLAINGLRAYKFVIVQPSGSITLSEISSLAALKKLVAKAQL